jgi:undecaprenyl-diphosphatase
MSILQALSIAVLQGITELFPISSLGHAVILPPLLGWRIDQHSADFLPFLVVLHVGTAAALLLYFWRDWIELGLGLIGQQTSMEATEARRLFALIVLATLPAVTVGFLLEKWLRGLFGSPVSAAVFLIANGFLLFAGDRVRRGGRVRGLESLDWKRALMIGCWQCTALFPGISRCGATMVGGLLAGLGHKEAAHFSFLIATPIIAGAAVLETPNLLSGAESAVTSLALAAGVIAGVTAYASVAFLMRYFRKHDFDAALVPFALYCWSAGVGALALLML